MSEISRAAQVARLGGDVVSVKDFGAVGDGVVNDKAAIEAAVAYVHDNGGGTVSFPVGVYVAPDLDFTGIEHVTFAGLDPQSCVIDVKGSTNTAAFRIGFDSTSGGSKVICIRDLGFKDGSGAIPSTRLISFEGGMAGQSPSETTGLFHLERLEVLDYRNTSGTAIYIDGLSHVEMLTCSWNYNPKYAVGLELRANVDVNTGVDSFQNCSIRGAQTALKIHATDQLMDSYAFTGCFFGNYDNAEARESIWIRGQNNLVSAVSFVGCHLECRHNGTVGDRNSILIEGNVGACTWDGFHISGGSSTPAEQADYGIRFKVDRTSGQSLIKGNIFNGLEILRVSDTGSIFGFDGDITTDIESPNHINGILKNNTNADIVEFRSGSNFYDVQNAVVIDGERDRRVNEAVATNSVFKVKPRYTQGKVHIQVSNFLNYAGTAMYKARPNVGGSAVALVTASADVEVGTGIPTGTTGTSGKVTIFSADDGCIYIENRGGFTLGVAVTFSDFYPTV